MCDHNQRNKPFFRAVGDENIFNLYSVCACPNGCKAPRPKMCIQTDSCTCKSTVDIWRINLHELDNPSKPLTAQDNEGYTYLYNPCSGLKLQNTSGKCDGVAACQYDPFADTYYNIGNTGPEIVYNSTSQQFTFYYTGGEGGRSFDVRMVCDYHAATSVLVADGDTPHGTTVYHLKLISKVICI